jgi:hypothetical protein
VAVFDEAAVAVDESISDATIHAGFIAWRIFSFFPTPLDTSNFSSLFPFAFFSLSRLSSCLSLTAAILRLSSLSGVALSAFFCPYFFGVLFCYAWRIFAWRQVRLHPGS